MCNANPADLQAAQTMLAATLQQKQLVLGPKHPHTLDALVDTANLHRMRDERDEAEQLYSQAGALVLVSLSSYRRRYHSYSCEMKNPP